MYIELTSAEKSSRGTNKLNVLVYGPPNDMNEIMNILRPLMHGTLDWTYMAGIAYI